MQLVPNCVAARTPVQRGEGRGAREGTRMGRWGASQAIAAGVGGLTGAVLADLFRAMASDATAFGLTFLLEAGLFLLAALVAARVIGGVTSPQARLVPGE